VYNDNVIIHGKLTVDELDVTRNDKIQNLTVTDTLTFNSSNFFTNATLTDATLVGNTNIGDTATSVINIGNASGSSTNIGTVAGTTTNIGGLFITTNINEATITGGTATGVVISDSNLVNINYLLLVTIPPPTQSKPVLWYDGTNLRFGMGTVTVT
jgi:hypothetical protein